MNDSLDVQVCGFLLSNSHRIIVIVIIINITVMMIAVFIIISMRCKKKVVYEIMLEKRIVHIKSLNNACLQTPLIFNHFLLSVWKFGVWW